ncbi:hypothetical protein EV196_10112 [Mariniflexile fucanivorans]|uniref:Uncharacterized protein n=1 Tax=Mariniflexile fucanivorans TaxID=264023 RepID=A0A4R1RQC3_9FLAO|nr:tRNA pseudouridine synthase A [Mariniflexile fucanivorans]TCL68598.1 hypothetical protein EV196_10112 [Mariniflexile fucanivorans]
METIKLQVSRKIYTKLLWLLSQFKSEDLKIIDDSESSVIEYLNNELKSIDSGDAEFLSLEELDAVMEERILKYEN